MTLPLLPTIPVRSVSAVHDGGEGAYVRQSDGTPLRVEISADAEYPQLTTVHEFAHYLDDCGFGVRTGWASEEDPEMEPLRQAWQKTEAVRLLHIGLETGRMTAFLPGGGTTVFPLMPEDRDSCRYYLQGRELFARSYAQYVASKSDNRVLYRQLLQRRESVEGRFYHAQWTESDFYTVSRAFDELFGRLKWLR